MQGGAEFLGNDTGFDHRHAGATVLLRHQQSGRPEVGETAPDLFVYAGWIVEQLAHMTRNRRPFRQKTPCGVAQCQLLVGEFEIHLRGNPSTRCAVMFLLIWLVPPAMVSEREVRR